MLPAAAIMQDRTFLRENAMRVIVFVVDILLSLMLLILFSCSRSVSKDQETPPNAEISGEHFGPVEKAPIMVKNVSPEYPQGALEMEITGTVWLKVFVDERGRILEAKIVEDSGKDVGFEEAALAAAVKTEWKPATSNGKPISVWLTYKVDFDIK
jgi:TonB family protein